MPGLLRLRPDNAPQVFFARDASPLEEHTRLREAFPGGGEVRVALTGPGLFTTEGLAWAGELETRLAEVEGVRLAAGPLAVHRWSESAWPPSDLAAYRARLDRAAAGRMAGWVAPDGGTLSSLVLFEPGAGPATLAAVEHAVSGSPTGVEVHLTGLPVLQRALDEGVQSVAFRIVPLLVGVSTLLLLLVFRRLRRALAPLLLVGFVELVTFGAMGYAGAPINLVNSVLAPLLFVIGLASAVHVLMQFVRTHTGGQDPVEAAQRTFRDKAPPIVWSGATTFVAFGSLALSDLPVVSALGGWSALGIAVLTAAMFTLYPALLVWAAGARGAHTPPVLEAHASRWGRSLAEGAVRHRHSVTVATLALMGACTAGLPRLAVGDDLVMAFREGHPARASLDFLQDEKMGAFPLEVLVELGAPESPEGAGLREPARLQALAELSARLRDDPRIAAAFGPGDLVEEAIEAILVEGEVDENLRWMALATVQSVPESKALLRS
ncbi:MAG: MMPL family transporter, partial [Deltaproteobacteria bacterium]|nr:MMPL family transporter [Deltaproteobacteria bacterium]